MTHMRIARAVLFVALLPLAACQLPPAVSGVCADVTGISAPAVAALDAQDPHSAVGVLWADVKAGCTTAATLANPGWTGQVWGELKAIIPAVLPQLIPLLVGLV